MNVLPSYEEATTAPDWLQFVVPFVPVASWRACCLVNWHFYRHFAPRLWIDPLVTVRALGLHPNDDLAWYRRFINKHVISVRYSTRAMVRSLDFRNFAVMASGLYSTEASERAISESFKRLPNIFPCLLCLLIDGHPELNPGNLVEASSSTVVDRSQHPLRLLDLAHCRHELTPRLFKSGYFRDLVYLDLSFIPGSVKSAVQSSLNPQFLPELRVLKVRGREMDNSTACFLFQAFKRHLWSLDVCRNKLTDQSIDVLLQSCFSSLSFHSDSHFETEGKLVRPRDIGTKSYGVFEFIEESDFSSSLKIPQRYMADAPSYSQRADQTELQEWQVVRSDGLERRKQDDAEEIKQIILSESTGAAISTANTLYHDMHASRAGITHLYLSDNSLTSSVIEKLMRESSGRLEHLDCTSCRLWSPGTQIPMDLPKTLRLSGLVGCSHLLRPVVSSSLRSLRIHHSLVTRIPDLRAEGLTARHACVLAETAFRERIKLAYPQAFEPDMNPRITSVTLTGIPARSGGPLIHEITRFLELASAQEKAVKEAKTGSHRHGPRILSGIRHIRLELEPDYREETSSMLNDANTDIDDLLDPGNVDFNESFSDILEDDHWDITSRGMDTSGAHKSSRRVQDKSRPEHTFSHLDVVGEYVTHRVDSADSWTGNVFSVPVWIGTGIPGENAAVNEYMSNLRDLRMHTNVGPATTNHVAAGVPSGSYIFYAAWDSMIYPKRLPTLKNRSVLSHLRDVASAIKEFRLRTKGTPNHWNGRLELVRTDSEARYQTSDYWR